MIKLTLDSSCFSRQDIHLERLYELYDRGIVELSIAPNTMDELALILSNKDPEASRERVRKAKEKYRDIIRKCIEKCRVLPYYWHWPADEFEGIMKRAFPLHTSTNWSGGLLDENAQESFGRRNTDLEIFSSHVMAENDIFVTNDEKGFLARQEDYEREFGTKVRKLDENLIAELTSSVTAA